MSTVENIVPPIGLMPEHIHKAKRLEEVINAIKRYIETGSKIPVEWIEEYNELLLFIKKYEKSSL